MRRVWRAALWAVLVAAPPLAAAAAPATPGGGLPELRSDAARSRDEQLRATRDYKESLERLLVLREADLQRALAQLDRTRELVDRGIVARNDIQTSERAVADARARLDQTWNEALVAATLIAKVLAAEDPGATRKLPPGGELATTTLVRYQGRRPWALSLTAGLQDFFIRTFGRPLPVSAYGQTAVHDKLGFDHRNAVDLAVHPDTAEGRAVMDWLRKSGLSFIAFRGAVAGAATGAHIHVGEPSQRLASP
jgi:hypothetical protein